MCLTVEWVPQSPADGLVVKCFKCVEEISGKFLSYIMGAKIPSNGWLLPGLVDEEIELKLKQGYCIEGGVIHAYLPHTKNNTLPDIPETKPMNMGCRYRFCPAYAIQVVAFEYDGAIWRVLEGEGKGKKYLLDALVCRALYVPAADTNPARRRATVAFLDKYAANTDGTINEILEKFPLLEGYVED